MTRLIELLISLAIVAALFLIIGVILPSSRHLEHSVETNRKLTIVYDTLNSVRRWPEWNPIAAKDPNMKIQVVGAPQGVGARVEYDSDERGLGEGSWEIVANDPNQRVAYAINNEERGENKRSEFILRPTGRNNRNVEVTQTYDVDYGWNLLGRYAGLYVRSSIGEDMKMGLSRLTDMLASVPNIDYSELAKTNPDMVPQIEERGVENLLVVTAAVERNNEVVRTTMKNNMQWIEKVMAANDLEPAGPVRIITNELGVESYSFDVAQPVRKKDSSAEAEEQAGDEAVADAEGEGEAPATAANAGPVEKLEIELEGPVTAEFTEPSRVAVLPYTGHMANLPNVRDALRAWSMTRGYETIGRPYDEWLEGIDAGFTPKGGFRVYWTLK
ncbi:MAG: SRPBCC family protein [Pseudomonadota bacterium]|nr:SRPBCC family protein [Pseudomonadota bacterium]